MRRILSILFLIPILASSQVAQFRQLSVYDRLYLFGYRTTALTNDSTLPVGLNQETLVTSFAIRNFVLNRLLYYVSRVNTIGSSPNANAATITGTELVLQPADVTYGGVVKSGVQTMPPGLKTWPDGLSSPGSGSSTEKFGSGANLGTGYSNTAIGNGANTSGGSESTVIGTSATANSDYAFAGGTGAVANFGSVALGRAASAGNAYSVAVGYSASTGGYYGTIVLGASAVATATNQFIVGTSTLGYQVSETYIGFGKQYPSIPTGYSMDLHSSDGVGTNTNAQSLSLYAGRGTGSGENGTLRLYTSNIGTTGSTLNPGVERMSIAPGGLITIPSPLKYTYGTPGVGKVLTSDATGNVTWGVGSSTTAWNVVGNAGTVDGTHFIGTTDNVPLNFKINGYKSGRIEGDLGITGVTGLNTFFGYRAGENTTYGNRNVAIGYHAMMSNQSGSNIAVGARAMEFSTGDWYENVAIGYAALSSIANIRNVAVGSSSMVNALNSRENSTLGNYTMLQSRNAFNNVAVGSSAMRSHTEGANNVAIGTIALTYGSTQVKSIDVSAGGTGYTTATVAISAPTVAAGDPGTITPVQATATVTLSGGVVTGFVITNPGSGYVNGATATVSGPGTGAVATVNLISDEYNVAVGTSALAYNTIGRYNTGIGFEAGIGSTGNESVVGDTMCTFVGYKARKTSGAAAQLFNATAIGYDAQVGQSNAIILGRTTSPTKVGIGTSTPVGLLDVRGYITGGYNGGNSTLRNLLDISDGEVSYPAVSIQFPANGISNIPRVQFYSLGNNVGIQGQNLGDNHDFDISTKNYTGMGAPAGQMGIRFLPDGVLSAKITRFGAWEFSDTTTGLTMATADASERFATTNWVRGQILEGSATLDFASTGAQTSSDLTITVTGAAMNDVVAMGVNNGIVLASTCFTAWVSATNTVTVRFNNYTTGASDPSSGLFKVKVFK